MASLQRVQSFSETTRDQLRALLHAASEHDGAAAFSDQAVLAAENGSRALFAVPHPTSADASTIGSVESSPAPIAFALIGAGEIDLVVHPDFRAAGVASAALNELLSFAHEQAEPQVRAWAHGGHAAQTALFTRAQFAPVRTLYKMSLDPASLVSAVEHSRSFPEGMRTVTFDPHSNDQIDAWVRINSAAFSDHPEQGRVSRSDFIALTQEPWFQAEDLIFAAGAQSTHANYLGFAWVKTVNRTESRAVDTELYVLAVDPATAGQGLGAALFGEALKQMRTHFPTSVSLYVDAGNVKAVELYKRAGFYVSSQSTQWEHSFTVQ